MTKVLFVDDDPLILAGLKRTLRHVDWEMEFVNSGHEALSTLEQQPFDAVVTDMRMPEMDGAELLTLVKERHPRMTRVILSGQSPQEAVLRVLGPAHQFLSKPCIPQNLIDAVVESLALRERLANPAIETLIASTTHLPSLPQLFQDLVAELSSVEPSIDRVCRMISQDVAMTSQILKLANSSFFGVRERITSPPHAVCLLGIELVKSLVLTVGIFSQCKREDSEVFSLERLTAHSLEVGSIARNVARSHGVDQEDCDVSLLAGMLHDVGKLVLIANDDYESVLQTAHDTKTPLWRVEQDRLGVSHAEVGGYLLALWGLPCRIVKAIAFHHEPSASNKTDFGPLAAVHIANAIVQGRASGEAGDTLLDQSFVTALGLEEQVACWQEEFAPVPA